MFKLLIADDEAGSREWLAQEIPWEDNDICIVGPAVDGTEAWQMIQEEKPEIVLTDIRMPGLSGIDLAKAIMEKFPCTRIIVISGYDEFAYAKACLEIGVSGYILKPSPPKEILAAVLKECEILYQRRVDEEAQARIRNQLENSRPLLQEQFLQELFQGNLLAENDLAERLDFLRLPVNPKGPVIVLLCRVEDQTGFYLNHSEKERQLIWLAIYNLVMSVGGRLLESAGLVTRLERGLVGALIGSGPTETSSNLIQEADNYARTILDEARLQLPCALQIGIGGIASTLFQADRSFEQAKQALHLQSSFGVEAIAKHSGDLSAGSSAQILSPNDEERLSVCLETGQSLETISLILQKLFLVKGSGPTQSSEYSRETGWMLVAALVRIAQGAGLVLHEVLEEADYALLMKGGPQGQPGQLIEWWQTQFGRVGHAIRKMTHTSLRSCIRQVKEYIDNHMTETISLSQAARSVFLSPSYLSRLFREQTNESFSEYVTRRKMEVARSLLEEGEKKVYEIASAVGYTDPAYFGRVFRQYFNVTPTDYKKA
jgi:Response regulator containing CheY-like receiver domain and AraC-type DNA-binding domain